jgi:excisionase family DNA binding protein
MGVVVLDSIAPTEEEIRLASESSRQLARLLSYSEDQIQIKVGDRPEETIELPASALQLLNRILTEMGQGRAVSLIPFDAELTTQRAADLLNVSRPYLIGLLDQGAIPYRKVGSHRRILLNDLLAYKNDIDEKRRATLRELAAEAQELNMGY